MSKSTKAEPVVATEPAAQVDHAAIIAEHEKINTELLAERDALADAVRTLEETVANLTQERDALLDATSEPAGPRSQVAGVAVVATAKLPIGKRQFTPGDPIGVVILEDGVTLLALAGAVYAGKARAAQEGAEAGAEADEETK